LLLPVLGSWLLVVLLTGYVSLASLGAGAVLVIAVRLLRPDDVPLLIFCLAVEMLVIYTHRDNIARMRAGTENRARKLWLFRSRAA
jgi:glycerol-3-phosphate acyltransferase PlsY